jgi:hypothetical protein
LTQKSFVQQAPQAIALDRSLAHLAADHHAKTQLAIKSLWRFPQQVGCCISNTKLQQPLLKALPALVEVIKNTTASQAMPLR